MDKLAISTATAVPATPATIGWRESALAMPTALQRDLMRRFRKPVAGGKAGFIVCGSPRTGGAENDSTGGTGRGAALGTHCQAASWISDLASRGRFDREASHSWLGALYRLELS
jgi:hypothetical protein